MQLASHNSWSYGRPQRWWMRVFQPFSKCQSESVRVQYLKGVRMFDLRLKYYNGSMYSAHGMVVYDAPSQDICTLSSMLWMWEEPVYVRVLLETRVPSEEEKRCFRDYCRWLEERFPKITFFGGHGAHGYGWRVEYYKFREKVAPPFENHASVADGFHPIPYLYARRHNREYNGEGAFLMQDFV